MSLNVDARLDVTYSMCAPNVQNGKLANPERTFEARVDCALML